MSTLAWIIAVALAGGVLSVVAAAAVTLAAGTQRVHVLISYAIGALLGAAFLEILPRHLCLKSKSPIFLRLHGTSHIIGTVTLTGCH